MTVFPNNSVSLAQLLKAAADELRLAILQVLAKDSYGVLELAQVFEIKQSGMSHHLKVLSSAGLIDSRREGNSIFYRRSVITLEDPHRETKRALFRQIDRSEIETHIAEHLEKIWQERADTSRRFFIDNAEKFSAQQDLIASFEVYRQPITEMLELSPLPQADCALELGPGQGEFLVTLNSRFQQVIAIDNSPEMLALAQTLKTEQKLNSVELILGDTDTLERFPSRFQFAIVNMVLHHLPTPSRLFQQLSNTLQPGGVLLVTELCSHDQTWVQQACGDIWLGFAPDELIDWAEEAQLKQGQSVYFALRNGFQVQVHQFIKTPA